MQFIYVCPISWIHIPKGQLKNTHRQSMSWKHGNMILMHFRNYSKLQIEAKALKSIHTALTSILANHGMKI